MCFMKSPSIPEPVRYQQSQEPIYREGSMTPSRGRGRRGTILSSPTVSGGTGGTGMGDTTVASKRTILGA